MTITYPPNFYNLLRTDWDSDYCYSFVICWALWFAICSLDHFTEVRLCHARSCIFYPDVFSIIMSSVVVTWDLPIAPSPLIHSIELPRHSSLLHNLSVLHHPFYLCIIRELYFCWWEWLGYLSYILASTEPHYGLIASLCMHLVNLNACIKIPTRPILPSSHSRSTQQSNKQTNRHVLILKQADRPGKTWV